MSAPDYESLLAACADIQQDLLVLLRLATDHREALLQSDVESCRSVFMLLVGSGFSLWRAAFLSHIDREWPSLFDKAQFLLEELLTTNAAPFGVEHKAKDWCLVITSIAQSTESVRQQRDSNAPTRRQHWSDLMRCSYRV